MCHGRIQGGGGGAIGAPPTLNFVKMFEKGGKNFQILGLKKKIKLMYFLDKYQLISFQETVFQ